MKVKYFLVFWCELVFVLQKNPVNLLQIFVSYPAIEHIEENGDDFHKQNLMAVLYAETKLHRHKYQVVK